MKTLFKIIGIAAGIYSLMGFSAFIGIACCDDYYNGRLDKNDKLERKGIDTLEANIALWRDIRKGKKSSKTRKRNKKTERSEVLRTHARKWADEGFSPEEIKQGLDLLRKKLD